VVDYLMKPFSFERFVKAIHKAQDHLTTRNTQEEKETPREKIPEEQFVFVKSGKKTYKVDYDDLLYIEALGDYVKIFTRERMIVSYLSMKHIESILPPSRFPRIHKSYIISLAKVEMIEGNQVKIKEKYIPVGSNYKMEFENLVKAG